MTRSLFPKTKNCCGDVKTMLQKIAIFGMDNIVRQFKTLKLVDRVVLDNGVEIEVEFEVPLKHGVW